MIVFDVNGVPVPQPRHRMRLLAGRNGAMHSYMAPSNHRVYGWRSRIALEARKHRPQEPWCGPVRVVLAFRIPAPQRVLRQRREEGGEYLMSQTMFGRRLNDRGFRREKSRDDNNRVWWHGVGLSQAGAGRQFETV